MTQTLECSVAQCSRSRVGRQDVCRSHYERRRRTGDASTPLRLRGAPTIERFLLKVQKTNSCWLWTASLNEWGYGRFGQDEGTGLAHRVAYELFIGPIPDGLELDHLCCIRHCVNPNHLEPVSGSENSRRTRRTHCVRGHEFTPQNTYLWRTTRRCRSCKRDYDRERLLAVKPEQRKGGGSDEARLGLVTRKPLAGGQGSPGPPCQYCGEVDGHTAQCPVVSHWLDGGE